MTLQERLPASRLGRARVLMLVFGVLLVLVPVGQLDTNSAVLPLSLAALVAIVGILLGTAWRGEHVTIFEAPATAILALLVGISMQDPPASSGICIGVIMTQTLYDRRLNTVLRLVSLLPVVPLVVTLTLSTVGGPELEWSSPASLAATTLIPLFVALVTILNGALVSQEQTLARASFMATMTGRLLRAADPRTVGDILASTTDGICDLVPGLTGVAVYRGTKTGPARIFKIHGAQGKESPEDIPAELLAPLDRLRPHELAELPGGTKALESLGLPKLRTWYCLPMGLPAEIEQALGVDTMLWGIPMCFSERFLGIPGPGGSEALELLQTATRHGQVAFDAAVERVQLLAQAQRDHTTGLLNRSTFTARLESLVAAGNPFTVVFIRLTGLAEISSRYGLFETGAVVAQLAHRLPAVVGGDTVTARFGDFAFGVALTGELTDQALAGMLDELRQSLSEPATMPNGMDTRIVAHIGTGRSRPGETADQLSLRVTQALLDDVQLSRAADALN